MSQDEFGQKMGYNTGTARRSVWQFLNRTADPRLSMIEKAAEALGVPVASLMADSDDAATERSASLHRILDVLAKHPTGMRRHEIAVAVVKEFQGEMESNPAVIRDAIEWLIANKEIQKGKDGRYRYLPGRATAEISPS